MFPASSEKFQMAVPGLKDFLKHFPPKERHCLVAEMRQISAQQSIGSVLKKQSGAALVLALAVLVLLLGITLAFFSKAALSRQVSSSSASSAQVELLGQSALGLVLADIDAEIRAGSLDDSMGGAAVPVHLPRLLPSGTYATPTAPSMRLQSVADGGIANLLKVSRSGQPFFQQLEGYTSGGLARASAISTAEPSLNNRAILPQRWNLPQLMTQTEVNSQFTNPDWIYMDREGGTPQDFSASNVTVFRDAAEANAKFIIGRYAYVLYDVGGLLDINVIGNRLGKDENSRRGRAHQITPSTVGGIALPEFLQFVSWRSPVYSAQAGSGTNQLFDPKRNFISVPPGEQTFINRQDLVRYAAENADTLPPASLPFLTTFTRDLNAPIAGLPRSLLLADPLSANEFNPPVAQIRFPNDTPIPRPEGSFTVQAGTPVMMRKFPLTKLNLLGLPNPDVDQLRYYFGLEKQPDGKFRYTAHVGGRIAKLSEVVAANREPNFFEILQAVLDHGSLGKSFGDTYTIDEERDSKQNLQIMQIGANIIDQWDADDIPTTVCFPAGNSDWLEFYGTENLPYINNIAFVPHFPVHDRDRFQLWAIFDVWNPHQNAGKAPEGIEELRIKAVRGQPYVYLNFASDEWGNLATPKEDIKQNIVVINQGRDLTFDPHNGGAGYLEPTIIRGQQPLTVEATPGILFADKVVGPAIVPEGNIFADLGFGTKAYNALRLRPPASTKANIDPNHLVRLELQALVNGQWITYQVLDDFMSPARNPLGGDTLSQTSLVNNTISKESSSTWPINTYYGKAPDANNPQLLENSFYGWRIGKSDKRAISLSKFDPRTIRFGHSGSIYETLGSTLRNSTGNYGGGAADSANFRIWAGNMMAGTTPNVTETFEKINYTGTVQRLPAFGLVYNSPDSLNNIRPLRYADRDGAIRPADGYLGALPTVSGRLGDRPVILNRPFRSVGEMGYAFRDQPWKTLDFFSRQSGDLGLLDVFSLDETEAVPPVVAGKVNLNTRNWAVLAALLQGSANGEVGLAGSVNPGVLDSASAEELAKAIVAENTKAPFLHVSDVVPRVLAPVRDDNASLISSPASNWKPIVKTVRESAIRTLSGLTTTRTWNLMVDLIVQSGRLSPTADGGEDFVVRGERRYWVHLAIDRLTGEVIEQRIESVKE